LLSYRKPSLNGEELHNDSTNDDENSEISKPEIGDSDDAGDSNKREIQSLYPKDLPDSRVQDDLHSNVPPLIHASDISDKGKGNEIYNIIHVFFIYVMCAYRSSN